MTTIVPSKAARPITVENGGRIPSGGSAGQALVKSSGIDYQVEWGTATASAAWGAISGTLASQTDLQSALNAKQATLVSGTNIKTLNGSTILGSGDLVISASAAWGGITGTLSSQTDLVTDLNSRDTNNRARANHTGTQTASTISDFNEAAQDAVGAMVDSSLTYVDATPLLQRAALTGAITASAGSNTTALGSFTKAQLDTAVSDGNVLYVGDVTTNATHTGDATGATALTLATVNSNVGSFGTATQVAQFTVNAKGLTTAAANVAISIPATAISDSTTAGRAVVTAATATAQTALFDVFTSAAKGLAPASGGGTTNFLRADGTWAAPPGGGGGVSDGDKGDITVSGTGATWLVDPHVKYGLNLAMHQNAFIP